MWRITTSRILMGFVLLRSGHETISPKNGSSSMLSELLQLQSVSQGLSSHSSYNCMPHHQLSNCTLPSQTTGLPKGNALLLNMVAFSCSHHAAQCLIYYFPGCIALNVCDLCARFASSPNSVVQSASPEGSGIWERRKSG